jgi:hypothetical protein
MTETEQTGLTTSDIAGTTTERDRRDERSAEHPESDADRAEPLLPADQTDRFRESWEEIQRDFVDRPRESVEQADALVADLMQRLAAGFSNERSRLESQWEGGDDVSTEDLRVALTRYRSFFQRLLSA